MFGQVSDFDPKRQSQKTIVKQSKTYLLLELLLFLFRFSVAWRARNRPFIMSLCIHIQGFYDSLFTAVIDHNDIPSVLANRYPDSVGVVESNLTETQSHLHAIAYRG